MSNAGVPWCRDGKCPFFPDGFPRDRITHLSKPELETAWAALGNRDGIRAYQAMWALSNSPLEAVPFLAERLRAVDVVAPEQIQTAIAELDSDSFAIRERATRFLISARGQADACIREALITNHSPESRRRLQLLLKDLQGPVADLPTIRAIRAVEALEYMGDIRA